MEIPEGKLLTDNNDILKEAVKYYKTVFKKRDMIEGLESNKKNYAKNVFSKHLNINHFPGQKIMS